MKIIVYGAAGRTGQAVLSELSKRGHDVTAVDIVSPKQKTQKKIKWVVTEVDDSQRHKDLLQYTDAVISTVGHTRHSGDWTQTDMIKRIIKHTPKHARIISLTGTGVRVTGDTPSLVDKVINFALKVIDPKRIEDGKRHVEELKKSKHNYTIIRVLKLIDTDNIPNEYTLSAGGPAQLVTPRKLVARVMCDLVEQNSWVRSLPVIS